MNPRGTFHRVYDAIRGQLEAAAFAPGEHIEPAHLADALCSSVTPVRDALQRLVGERLVEASPGDGFRLPILTELGLRQLYDWHCQLLLLALKRAPGPLTGPLGRECQAGETAGAALVARTEALFAALSRRSANMEHVQAVLGLGSRLSMVRHKETGLIPNGPAELEALEKLAVAGELAGLRRAIISYHRRRQRIADQLVVAMQIAKD